MPARFLTFFARARRGAAPLALAVALAACVPACSDDSDTIDSNAADGGKTGDTASLAGAPVVTTAAAPVGGAVWTKGEWQADRKRISVEVRVQGSVPLVGLAGHLRWDPAVLRLDSTDVNSKLLVGDASVWEQRTVNKETEAGRLLLGSARFRKELSFWSGVESLLIKDDRWLTLSFEVLAPGKTDVGFHPDSVVARDDTGAQQALTWTVVQVDVPADFAATK